MYFLISCLH